jgi:hypothetical protein
MSICLIDTSVLCNIVKVPGKCQQFSQAVADLEKLIRDRATLLLPMAAIFETGNHIAHIPDGTLRRKAALKFVTQVRDALEGKSPWTPIVPFPPGDFSEWLSEFPDHATRQIGLGDLSIIKEWERQCVLHPKRRVFIWTFDGHLQAYDR